MQRNSQNSMNKHSRWDKPADNNQPQYYQAPFASYQPPQSYQPPLPLPVYKPSDVFSLVDSGPLLKSPQQIAFVSKNNLLDLALFIKCH